MAVGGWVPYNWSIRSWILEGILCKGYGHVVHVASVGIDINDECVCWFKLLSSPRHSRTHHRSPFTVEIFSHVIVVFSLGM